MNYKIMFLIIYVFKHRLSESMSSGPKSHKNRINMKYLKTIYIVGLSRKDHNIKKFLLYAEADQQGAGPYA